MINQDPYSVKFDTTMGDQRDVIDSLVQAAREIRVREQEPTGRRSNEWAVPHELTYSSVYNWYQRYYYNYFDESLIDSQANSLAMWHDGFVQELWHHRSLPVVCLEHSFSTDDPDDPDQVKVRKQIATVIDNIQYFQQLKLQLLQASYFGKSGTQFLWGSKKIAGQRRWTITKHNPVQGDKIVFKFDGTPGILVYGGAVESFNDRLRGEIMYIDKGPALFLNNEDLLDRFCIHRFERTDTDYMSESQKALGIQGLGLRDKYYWAWNMRAELIGWIFNALQRVGANGMLYAYYQAGNPDARDATLEALRNLVQENIAAFPAVNGVASDEIRNIQTTGIGYDVMYNLLVHFEEIMRRGFLGQNLSSQSAATGLGSGVADLQGDMFQNIVIYDSSCLAETIDEQIVKKIIKFNKWEYKGKLLYGEELPFNVKFEFKINRRNLVEIIQAARELYQMGVPLDLENLRDMAGLIAPKNKSTTIVMPGGESGQASNDRAIRNETQETRQPREQPRPKVKNPEQTDRNKFELFERDASDPGVFISFTVPKEISDQISYPDSDPYLHCTVAYLGRLSEIGHENAVIAAESLRLLADKWPSLSGHIGGIGRFSATDSSDGKDVVYAGVDIPDLSDFRAELCHVLGLAGVPYKKNHGYTPHVTLKYIDMEEENPNRRIPNLPVTFNSICFKIGEYIEEIPFGIIKTDDAYELFDATKS